MNVPAGAVAPVTLSDATTGQLRQMLNTLRAAEPQLALVDGFYWLVLQQFASSGQLQAVTAAVRDHLLLRESLKGLLELALNRGNTSADVLRGIVLTSVGLIRSIPVVGQTWAAFLQLNPSVLAQPNVQNFAAVLPTANDFYRSFDQLAGPPVLALLQALRLT